MYLTYRVLLISKKYLEMKSGGGIKAEWKKDWFLLPPRYWSFSIVYWIFHFFRINKQGLKTKKTENTAEDHKFMNILYLAAQETHYFLFNMRKESDFREGIIQTHRGKFDGKFWDSQSCVAQGTQYSQQSGSTRPWARFSSPLNFEISCSLTCKVNLRTPMKLTKLTCKCTCWTNKLLVCHAFCEIIVKLMFW